MVAKAKQPDDDVLETVWDVYDRVPENLRAEVITGTLYVEPRPASDHAVTATSLSGELYAPFQRGRGGPGGWILLAEPELRLGDDAVAPDLAGWRRERMPTVEPSACLSIAPDWICEVLSPSTEHRDRHEKMAVYSRERVPWLWLVSPKRRALEGYRLEGDAYAKLGEWTGDASVRIAPFDAVEIPLGVLWTA